MKSTDFPARFVRLVLENPARRSRPDLVGSVKIVWMGSMAQPDEVGPDLPARLVSSGRADDKSGPTRPSRAEIVGPDLPARPDRPDDKSVTKKTPLRSFFPISKGVSS